MKCRLKLTLLRLIWFNIASRNVKQPSVYCKPLGDPCQAGKKKLEGDGPVHVFDQVQTQDWRQTLWDRTGDLRMYRRGTKTKICLWIQPSHCVSMGLFLKRRPLAVCVCACMYVCVCVCVSGMSCIMNMLVQQKCWTEALLVCVIGSGCCIVVENNPVSIIHRRRVH